MLVTNSYVGIIIRGEDSFTQKANMKIANAHRRARNAPYFGDPHVAVTVQLNNNNKKINY